MWFYFLPLQHSLELLLPEIHDCRPDPGLDDVNPPPIADCRLPIAHCPLPIAHCPLPIADYRLPIADCQLPIDYFELTSV
jgi:hypothetical protein